MTSERTEFHLDTTASEPLDWVGDEIQKHDNSSDLWSRYVDELGQHDEILYFVRRDGAVKNSLEKQMNILMQALKTALDINVCHIIFL
jgi:hypothetical protein